MHLMLRLFGLIDNNALKIAEKALASLGAFSTIFRALLSIIPQNVTLLYCYIIRHRFLAFKYFIKHLLDETIKYIIVHELYVINCH